VLACPVSFRSDGSQFPVIRIPQDLIICVVVNGIIARCIHSLFLKIPLFFVVRERWADGNRDRDRYRK
jgi:hypothetical protein